MKDSCPLFPGALMRTMVATLLTSLTVLPSRAEKPDENEKKDVIHQVATFTSRWNQKMPHDDPRFGIIRILSLLNLDHPGLEKVKAAADAKQYDVAESRLLEYFKATRLVKPGQVRLDEQSREIADNALLHVFPGNGKVHPPVFRGAQIDWTGRAFVDGKEIHDNEWYFQFQRLTWWPSLAKSYRATNDLKYFHEWRFEMVSWAEALLPFDKKTPGFVTRALETDSRCGVLAGVFPDMLLASDFDSKTLLYYLGSFHAQAEHIPKVYAKEGNHRLAELCRVFRNSQAFPEFKQSSAWKKDAVTLLPRMMEDSVYEDGMNKELVFSYHGMYVGLFTDVYQMFKESGHGDVLPQSYYPRLLKMAEIYAMQSFPDFSLCQFGDAWKRQDAGHLFRRTLAPFAKDIPYHEFMASGGKKGSPPAKKSAAYPESGFYFFRSDWNPNAVFMALKCSPVGEWHNQIDNGTFELYAYGQNLMTDSGCYLYGSSSPEEQKWREWFRSSKAHQTLTLDHRDADRKPRHILWSDSEKLTALVVENQSYPGLAHRRTVLFVDRKYFVIHDEAIGKDAGEVRVHFQFAPGDFEQHDLMARTKFAEGGNLLVRTFQQKNKILTEKEDGWISYKMSVKEPRPAWSWRIDKSPGVDHVDFLTTLVPFEKGTEPKSVEASVTATADVKIFRIREGNETKTIRVDLKVGSASVTDHRTGSR